MTFVFIHLTWWPGGSNSKTVQLSEMAERGSIFNDFTNQFWFETLLHGNFAVKWWKENFRLSRCVFEHLVRVAGPDLAYILAAKTKRCRKRDRMRLTQSGQHRVRNTMLSRWTTFLSWTGLIEMDHSISPFPPILNPSTSLFGIFHVQHEENTYHCSFYRLLTADLSVLLVHPCVVTTGL